MKRLIEAAIVALMIWIIIATVATPIAIAACYNARGCFVIGGEWGILLTVPIALAGIVTLYRDAVK
jgi:hypothetical protein